jgi:hypothetical protein
MTKLRVLGFGEFIPRNSDLSNSPNHMIQISNAMRLRLRSSRRSRHRIVGPLSGGLSAQKRRDASAATNGTLVERTTHKAISETLSVISFNTKSCQTTWRAGAERCRDAHRTNSRRKFLFRRWVLVA